MRVEKSVGSVPIKIWADEVEPQSMEQLRNLATLPFIHKHGVAAMPDVHWGNGTSVGTVIATDGVIIPAAVGVDIGCGVIALRLPLKADELPDSLAEIRHSIERGVPLGAGGKHNLFGPQLDARLRFVSGGFPVGAVNRYESATMKAAEQLGTLGSGNHFIELCLDERQDVWVMLHSGSRGIGNMIGTRFISIAKRHMEQYFVTLPDANLAYLPDGTQDFDDYVNAVSWAQDYAAKNRSMMMDEVLRNLRHHIKPLRHRMDQIDAQTSGQSFYSEKYATREAINCHHNYIAKENHFGKNVWLTRKGAIRARTGDLGIIPGSMGTRSYIVRGLGNADSYHSCSHGAGRIMSRTEARKRFTVDDLAAQTVGVECRKDSSVLDEIPGSYKDIDAVMAQQPDLVEPVHTLKAVMCVKGG